MPAKSSTRIAAAQCANWNSGNCLSMGIADDGSLYGLNQRGPCRLSKGEACEYLQECVLGSATRKKPGKPSLRGSDA